MRTTKLGLLVAIAALAGQSQQAPDDAMPGAILPMPPVIPLEDALVRWPLPPGDPAYAAIDGHHLHQYVIEQAAISRRYRDRGHPQFWGRIIGTSADAESAQWLAAKFRQIGLSDVHLQPLDLAPQWMPQSWKITATGSGKTLHLDGTAQPAYETPGTKPGGLDLEAVYVGTGSEADFAGREVRGKAAFIYSMPLPGGTRPMANAEGATKRAEEKGAAAIFLIVAQPGNMRTQLYPTGTHVPTFALGMQDGYAVRDLIGQAPAGQPPRVKIQLTVDRVPNLKTSTVWGTLPGATDENIYVIAHRDGWFDAAGDNASGVATMIGLAEYYAKIPKAQRRRTLIFLGTTGHHNSANLSVNDLIARHNELFAKTALLINSEHSSTLQTYLYTESIRRANTYTAQFWYAGGPSRPKLQDLAIKAFHEFGVSTYAEPDRAALPGDMSGLYRIVPGVTTSDFNTYFHTNEETPEVVPWTGLEATTRAYAKIIDGVNRLDLKDLQRPPEPQPPRSPAASGGMAGVVPPAPAVYKLEDAFLEWPLPQKDRAYGTINGHHLHEYVVEQSAISRRYRDRDHPQFWGRIIGTSADAEAAQWMVDKFKKIGLSDVRVQPLDLTPQWMPQSWEIMATAGGKTLRLDKSAQPAYLSDGTGPDGLDLEAVWAGTGSEADFAGRDVRGKAVFMFSMPLPGSMEQTLTIEGGLKRAEAKGAAAIFDVIALPGNMKNELYPTGGKVPTFALGMEDGYAMREMIGNAPAGRPPRVKIRMEIKRVPGMKTALVWGALPGATDEKIYVMAHRDGWFDAATDNASGVATMLGLAEYFSKIPKAQRRRTMVFIGLDGHHNDTRAGRNWLIAHKDEVFANTALVINAEHTSTLQTYLYWEAIRKANTYTAQMWYAGGPTRPKLQDIAVKAFREFGVTTYAAPEKAPPLGDLGPFYRFAPGVDVGDYNMYFHTDAETPDTVPWTGLEATTRAYAKIIDGVNRLDLKDLQPPAERASQ